MDEEIKNACAPIKPIAIPLQACISRSDKLILVWGCSQNIHHVKYGNPITAKSCAGVVPTLVGLTGKGKQPLVLQTDF